MLRTLTNKSLKILILSIQGLLLTNYSILAFPYQVINHTESKNYIINQHLSREPVDKIDETFPSNHRSLDLSNHFRKQNNNSDEESSKEKDNDDENFKKKGSVKPNNSRFGEKYCNKPGFTCKKITKGQTWKTLFLNKESRDLVQRLNRMNIPLQNGMIIAIPINLERLSLYDIAPFPRYIKSDGEKMIYVNQDQLAWGAYDADGELLLWGPISPGIKSCPNILGGCATPEGVFRIIRKQDGTCISTSFPRRANGNHGGAEMPFCMHFFRGYALHGSHELPGYPASHGCVRLFLKDAEWLNEEFIDIPGGGMSGTLVVISET